MFMKRIRGVGVVCVSLLLAWPALAKDKVVRTPKGQELEMPKQTAVQPGQPKEAWVNVNVAISDHERKVISGYCEHYHSPEVSGSDHRGRPLPPGLAKKAARGRELPPGWQKKCAVGEVMPVEVYECSHPLPPDLVVKLPPPPPDTITITVEGKVVRLLKATREILDVFDVGVRL
jgi:hypothetical protein